MKARVGVLTGLAMVAALVAPAYGGQVSAEDHAKHHPEAQAPKAAAPVAPVATQAKLDELVKKMNAAQGQAKVDAIAELLTALVQQHQGMHGNMGQMMQKMGGGGPK